ncbi:multidrug transporter [Bifidobacterium aquikefiri]|uniref:Multidrug transporter n=2 Tax=Bifidobacterium aquikefiri TaxID=1653207 RepID=A0A261G6Y5_9BIFI|nr:multidrug transporter [Bifidobacterium aquikefiri]
MKVTGLGGVGGACCIEEGDATNDEAWMKGTRSWHDEVLGNGYSLLYLLQRRQDRQSSLVIARPLCSLITAELFTLTVWVWYTWLGVLVVHGTSLGAAKPNNNTEERSR